MTTTCPRGPPADATSAELEQYLVKLEGEQALAAVRKATILRTDKWRERLEQAIEHALGVRAAAIEASRGPFK